MNPPLPDPLRAAARTLASTPIAALFDRDPRRVERLTWTWDGFRVDLSKERITPEAMTGLCAHAAGRPGSPGGSPRCSRARR